MFNNIINNPSIKRGFKNASYLALANVISQLITFFSFMLVARYFNPAEYGIYSIVTTYTSMFEILSLQGLKKTIIRKGALNERRLLEVLYEGLKTKYFFIALSFSFCLLVLPFINYETEIKLFIVFFSISIIIHELQDYLNIVFMVKEEMNKISFFTILNRILFILLVLFIIYIKGNILSLIIINLTVITIILILTFIYIRKKFLPNLQIILYPRFSKDIFRSGLVFSLFSAITLFATRFDLFIISILGTPEEVGIYSVAYRIVTMGIMLRNVNQDAFFPIFVKKFETGKINKNKLIKSSILLFIAIMIITIILSFYCENIISFLFGKKYSESGYILSYLLYFLAFVYATLPFTLAAQATFNEKILLRIRIFMAILNVILDIVFYKLFGLIGIAYSSIFVWGIGGTAIIFSIYKILAEKNIIK